MDEKEYLKRKKTIKERLNDYIKDPFKYYRLLGNSLIIAGNVILIVAFMYFLPTLPLFIWFLWLFIIVLSAVFVIVGTEAKSKAMDLVINLIVKRLMKLMPYYKERKRRKLQYCPSCGKELQPDWNFCGCCGKRLKKID